MSLVFLLLLVFQAKHFLADYPLQSNRYMIGKFKPWPGFVGPLAAHAAVHGVMTLAIALWLRPALWWLALVDFFAHAGMDWLKANPSAMGRWKALSASEFPTATAKQYRGNTLFWWALGFDQAVHHLTHYFCIWMLVTP